MAMHFVFSDKVMLLFDFWSVHSPAGMALSVLVVLLLAVLYEGIKVGKAKLLYHTLASLHTPASQELILGREPDSVDSDSLSVSRTPLSSWQLWAKASTHSLEFGGHCTCSLPSQPEQGLA
ncbi:protein SLC31A2 isoform 3-T3 [Erethizon dorsatum]